MTMAGRVVGRVIGRGWLAVIIALLVAGGLAVLVEAQSPSAVYWTGDRVAAYSEGGIIFYRYRGQDYTISDDDRGAADTQRVPVPVWVDPDDPTQARADNLVRWVDAVSVAGWFVAVVALLPVACVRQRRRLRRQQAFAASG